MNQIGFKNFRRFGEFPMIDLGEINMFVGKNSSGKSTLIKAIILGIENILHLLDNRLHMRYWSFATSGLAHLNLGSFFSNLKSGEDPSSMRFTFVVGDVKVEIQLDGSSIQEGDSAVLIPIRQLKVNHTVYQAGCSYERINNDTFKVIFKVAWEGIRTSYQEEIDSLNERIRTLTSEMEEFQSRLNNNYPINKEGISIDVYEKFIIDHMYLIDNKKSKIYDYEKILSAIENKTGNYEVSWKELCHKGDVQNKGVDIPDVILEDDLIKWFWFRLFKLTTKSIEDNIPNYQFIETHIASHNELLFIEDKNNYLMNTVLNYVNSGVQENNKVKEFVIRWLKEFEIADDFVIEQPYCEAFRVLIKSGSINRPLGSMGTGSIQLFTLLLQMANALIEEKQQMLFIEEPEQNLHPAFQSKLADLFVDINKLSCGRIKLVVETHSEYLVRRTQVLVASAVKNEGEIIDNINKKIKVFYFSDDEKPYSMEYRENGHFYHSFGTGFFDEAGRHYMNLIKQNF